MHDIFLHACLQVTDPNVRRVIAFMSLISLRDTHHIMCVAVCYVAANARAHASSEFISKLACLLVCSGLLNESLLSGHSFRLPPEMHDMHACLQVTLPNVRCVIASMSRFSLRDTAAHDITCFALRIH